MYERSNHTDQEILNSSSRQTGGYASYAIACVACVLMPSLVLPKPSNASELSYIWPNVSTIGTETWGELESYLLAQNARSSSGAESVWRSTSETQPSKPEPRTTKTAPSKPVPSWGQDSKRATVAVNPTNSIDLIGKYEWFHSTPYWDVTGWAIGFWQHYINGVKVKKSDTITREEALQDLTNRLDGMQFKKLVSVKLTESQEAALSSFEHNLGPWVWHRDGKAIISNINKWDFKSASSIMRKFVYSDGNVLRWLVNRRNHESALMLM